VSNAAVGLSADAASEPQAAADSFTSCAAAVGSSYDQALWSDLLTTS